MVKPKSVWHRLYAMTFVLVMVTQGSTSVQ